MPLDIAQRGLGFELASLRALGEGRRRRSLADRLLRERRDAETFDAVRVAQIVPKAPLLSPAPTEP